MQSRYDEYYCNVTALILTYNQEDFVEECVLSVLNQECPKINIVFSDDASPDRSYEVLERCVAEYKGPHNVALYKNDENMGVIRHFNTRVGELNRPLVIPLGGDDIWELDRVKKTVEFWVDNDFPTAISVNPMMIDAEGHHIRRWLESPPEDITLDGMLGLGPSGCFFGGVHRDVFETFGPLSERAAAEDFQIFFRAALMGSAKTLMSNVQYYRQHDANMSFAAQMIGTNDEDWLSIHKKELSFFVEMNLLWMRDLELALEKGYLTTERKSEIGNLLISRNRVNNEILSNLSREVNYFRSLRVLLQERCGPKLVVRVILAAVSSRLYARVLRRRYTRDVSLLK